LNSIVLYASKTTFRLKYTCNLVFKDLLGLNFQITNNKEEFIAYTGPKISYAAERVYNEPFFICSENILFQTGIKEKNLMMGEWRETKVLFSKQNGEKVPFDLFGAVFFLVTRYEEYLPHVRDQYDRFEAESSIAFIHQFLRKPLVNIWVKFFKDLLLEEYPSLQIKEPGYHFISTIDIDNAYAFAQKGVMRTVGGYIRALVNLNWKNLRDRTRVLFGFMPDPFDSYSHQLRIQKKYNIPVIYFFLLGDYGVNDKNLPSNHRDFQRLIKHLADYAQVGIHPSFGSNDDTYQVRKEISRLTNITHREIINSRQHYARLHFPGTYKTIIENGIQNDFSMGYHNQPGFRASISTPYYWYDLESESETSLKIYPYIFSETSLRFGVKLRPDEALETVRPLINEIKATGGTFTSMFNNESLGDYGEWHGWKDLYEEVVTEATKK
jgi:hypothetical protein